MLFLIAAVQLLFAPNAIAGCDVITSSNKLMFSGAADPTKARFKIFYKEEKGKTAFGEQAVCPSGDSRCQFGDFDIKNHKQIDLPLCSNMNIQEANAVLKAGQHVNDCENRGGSGQIGVSTESSRFVTQLKVCEDESTKKGCIGGVLFKFEGSESALNSDKAFVGEAPSKRSTLPPDGISDKR